MREHRVEGDVRLKELEKGRKGEGREGCLLDCE